MSLTQSFVRAYNKLNLEQKKAVDTIDGPVMVVAGPGTGKTQTIALRIANILARTDTEPDAVLALTFTESGARAMRERLASLIGTPAYYCHISTFHAFCVEVMQDNPDRFVLDLSAEPLSDLEKLRLVYQILDQGQYSLLRPLNAPYLYAKAVIGSLSDLKREGVSPEHYADLLKKEQEFLTSSKAEELTKTKVKTRLRDLGKNQELLTLYRAYQKELTSSLRFDFEDMINSVVNAFRLDPDLLLSYQERFQYLLVDEYQDTNSSQNDLLLLLTSYWGERANIMVTGDPDQSIMRFQGASIENQLGFVKHFPHASVITLKTNYRSTQSILDAADSLISHNRQRINDVVAGIDPHLTAAAGKGSRLRVAELSTSVAEHIFIAESVKNLLDSGTSAGEIAIIYRNNRDSRDLAEMLVKYGIDYTIRGGADILEDPTVRNFIKILRVVYEMRRREEDENLFTILHYDIFALDPLDVLKLSRLAGDNRSSLFDVLATPSQLDELELKTRDRLLAVLDDLAHWNSFDAGNTFTATFEEVLNKSGYLTWVLNQQDAHHRLSRLNTLFEEVKKMNRFDHDLDLKGFLANLALIKENHLRIEENSFGTSADAVTLTTAHKSKGLEWEHVFIYRAADKTWGNNQNKTLIRLPDNLLENSRLSDKEKNEDERRLFYVAATRAKRSLTISHAAESSQGGSTRASVKTMFLSELGDSHLEELDTSQIEQEAHAHIERVLKESAQLKSSKPSVDEQAYLNDLVAKFELSPTALNSYLECAYKFKLDKLLRVPHSKKPHLAFGTAVHAALEHFYRNLQTEGTKLSKKEFLETFDKQLHREVISKQDLAERLDKGTQILSAYYDLVLKEATPPLYTEKSAHVQLGDIKLTGKIDRIEWLNQADRTVRVVDYKTGKTKTMGQILGTTKDSQGDLKRQLVFYKLLIDLDTRLKFKFGEGQLDFIQEPEDKGKDGRRTITIKDKEEAELKATIRAAVAEIRALSFPRTTDYSICKKCDFRDHCYPEGIPTS